MKLRRVACVLTAAAPWVYLGLLRPWQLTWGSTVEEVRRDLPGDSLVPHPLFEATRGVTVSAPPERVWPWIVQMGTGRAGWYAIDLVDNLGQRSADTVVPELQRLSVGDVMPTGADGDGFRVVQLERERLLVLHIAEATIGPAKGGAVIVFSLEPSGEHGTRLLCRLRADVAPNAASRLYGLLLETGDFVMMRMMLSGIKARAERSESNAPGPVAAVR